MTEDNRLRKTARSVVICICGMAGSGKSTLARKLARKYGLKYCSGGDALKDLAIDEGYNSVSSGWWETSEGMRFLEKRREDHEYDRAIDKKLLRFAEEGNVVLDSWTMPWLLDKAFKIWLEASPETRSRRIAKRDNMVVEKALEALRKKESQTRDIYRKLYGFNLGEDYEPFDLILDTEALEAEEVLDILCAVMDNYLLRR